MIKKSVQERVDALFSSFTEAGSPGCALGIMKGGDLVYKQGYGLANLEHSVTITPSTTFYIASMAKQFTGMAIALLAEQGKIDLDADIRTYLPYVPEFGHAITTRHLLHHTSGLRSDIFLLLLSGWRIEDVITQDDIVGFVKGQRELDFVPGEEFAYCGTGYSLLAEIVAAVSGQTFPEYCHESIFQPLSMANTRFEADPIALVPGRANAYFAVAEGEYKNAVLTISILGGTGVYTTIEDLALWDENFYSHKIGGAGVLEMMQTPGVLNSGEALSYAFGLVVEKHRGRAVVSHAGDSAGVHCYMMRLPEEHLSVAILGNASTVRASALAGAVADIMLGVDPSSEEEPANETDDRVIVDLDPDILEARAGRYYDAKSGAFVDLLLKEGKLTIYGYELSATSEDAFFVTQHPEATVTFAKGSGGSLAAAVDIGNGGTTYERVEAVEPTCDQLAEYAGTYHSVELDVTWRVALEDERLAVHRKRQGVSHLVPVCQDVFADAWAGQILHGSAQWVIAFDRSEDRIDGLRVTAAGARGRNLRFDKTG